MSHSPVTAFLLDRGKRSLLATAGLIVFTYGFFLQLQANMGLAPWNALNQGLSMQFSITLGTASLIVSGLIILADLLMRETIGLGTVLDAVVVGVFTDIFVALDIPSPQTALLPQLTALLLGILLCVLGQWIYMTAALSCGPRDAFLVGLGKRFSKVKIGTVNIGLLLLVLAVGIALGSPFGPGTVIATFGTGFIMDFVFKLVRFEPRTIEHESLVATAAALVRAVKEGRTARSM